VRPNQTVYVAPTGYGAPAQAVPVQIAPQGRATVVVSPR
jgi:hypothetical protein